MARVRVNAPNRRFRVCQVWADADMPVDKHGTRADIICDGNTTLNRMNPPRLFEQYLNGTSDQIEREFRALAANGLTDEVVAQCWERILRYYQITSPIMYETITSASYQQTPRQHIESILNTKPGIRLFLPTDNNIEIVEMMEQLMQEFPLDMGPVSFRGKSGTTSVTAQDVLIASIYFIELEKTGSDWSAVSSGTLQQHGVLTKITRFDKHARPGRASSTRTLGEDEMRAVSAFASANASSKALAEEGKFGPTVADGLAAAEMADLSNNPAVHMEANRVILTADRPTDIKQLIDREKFPRGNSRSLTYVLHALQVAGLKLTHIDDDADDPTIYRLEEQAGDDNDIEVEADEEE